MTPETCPTSVQNKNRRLFCKEGKPREDKSKNQFSSPDKEASTLSIRQSHIQDPETEKRENAREKRQQGDRFYHAADAHRHTISP